mmetsp:Transcript_74796/g.231157  ORF Transcript_74796/g.231157 Transcript_74796/m.231157 type:complete len:236 (+) Transcript_74796:505-1212(+)
MAQWGNTSASQLLLTCSHDATVAIWDTKTMRPTKQLPAKGKKDDDQAHTKAIWSAYWSSNDELIVTASKDKTAKIWDVPNQRRIETLSGHTDAMLHARFNPADNNQVLTCSMDSTARLWDRRSGTTAMLFDHHKACVWSAIFGADPNRILTASHDMTANVYDTRLQLPKNALGGHTGILWGASLSPDDHWVVTCSEDTTARVWNLQTGARRPPCHILRKGKDGHSDAVTCAAFLR